MRTPDYVLTEPFTDYKGSNQDNKILPAGAFVRPIEFQYLPDHIRKNRDYVNMDKEKYVFCHSSIGMILVPRKQLRSV